MPASATSLELDPPIGDHHRTVECGDVVASADNVTQLIPGTSTRLSHLSDGELLNRTRQLVGKSNLLFAALLEHLAEVEARGLHRTRACASLYTYCIYELRFSEDAAARRVSAARLVKRFPAAFDAIAKGELHLTGLLMLGPHLTDANHVEVLGRAKFRTKKEIAKLIRSLAPLPDVPDQIEPLRPALPRSLRRPTWAEFVESFCPPVRELKSGERPSDWVNDGECPSERTTEASDEAPTGLTTAPARVPEMPHQLPPITGPQVYQMQFTTSEEHVELVERAKALLANKASLGEVHLQAMRLLVEVLEKRRFGAEHPRRCGGRNRKSQSPAPEHPCERGTGGEEGESRYIPAAIRRAVFERDEGRCTFVDERGQRCCETNHLEIDHVEPFARGGRHVLGNLRLRCRAHNAMTAEEEFGRRHVESKRDGRRHEPLRRTLHGASATADE